MKNFVEPEMDCRFGAEFPRPELRKPEGVVSQIDQRAESKKTEKAWDQNAKTLGT